MYHLIIEQEQKVGNNNPTHQSYHNINKYASNILYNYVLFYSSCLDYLHVLKMMGHHWVALMAAHSYPLRGQLPVAMLYKKKIAFPKTLRKVLFVSHWTKLIQARLSTNQGRNDQIRLIRTPKFGVNQILLKHMGLCGSE